MVGVFDLNVLFEVIEIGVSEVGVVELSEFVLFDVVRNDFLR